MGFPLWIVVATRPIQMGAGAGATASQPCRGLLGPHPASVDHPDGCVAPLLHPTPTFPTPLPLSPPQFPFPRATPRFPAPLLVSLPGPVSRSAPLGPAGRLGRAHESEAADGARVGRPVAAAALGYGDSLPVGVQKGAGGNRVQRNVEYTPVGRASMWIGNGVVLKLDGSRGWG